MRVKKPSLLTFSVLLISGHLSLSCAFSDRSLQALNVLLNKTELCVLTGPSWHRFSLPLDTKSEQTLECVTFYPKSMMLST